MSNESNTRNKLYALNSIIPVQRESSDGIGQCNQYEYDMFNLARDNSHQGSSLHENTMHGNTLQGNTLQVNTLQINSIENCSMLRVDDNYSDNIDDFTMEYRSEINESSQDFMESKHVSAPSVMRVIPSQVIGNDCPMRQIEFKEEHRHTLTEPLAIVKKQSSRTKPKI